MKFLALPISTVLPYSLRYLAVLGALAIVCWSQQPATASQPIFEKFAVRIDVETAVDGSEVNFSKTYRCQGMARRRSLSGELVWDWETDVRNVYEQLDNGEVLFVQVPPKCEQLAGTGKFDSDSYLPVMGLLDRLEKPTRIELYGSIAGFRDGGAARVTPPKLQMRRLSDDALSESDRRLDWIVNRISCHGGVANAKVIFAGYFMVSIPEELWSAWAPEFVQFYESQTNSQRIQNEQFQRQLEIGFTQSFKRRGGAALYEMGAFERGLQRTSGEKSIFDYFVPLEQVGETLIPNFEKKGALTYHLAGASQEAVNEDFYGRVVKVEDFSLTNEKPYFWRVFLAKSRTVNFLSSITQCY